MIIKHLVRLLSAACTLLAVSAPISAMAEDLIVEHNTVPGHFLTIQAAIDHATILINANPNLNNNFRILVQADPVPYTGPITPISNVPIIGSSTAGTFIAGSGSGTLISLSNVTNVFIRNFTFRNASVGISVANSSNINITNNVFQLGTAATALLVQVSPSTSIINNTFFNNGTAISTTSDILITNDIFSTNTTAIFAQASLTQASYNDFFANGTIGITPDAHSIPNIQSPFPNPLFVDPANRDFHLQSGSPCINSGNPSYHNSFDSATIDMGAYGGTNADIILATVATVTGLTSSVTSPLNPPTTINLNWNPTSDSAVTAYRIYYGTSSGNYNGTQATEGNSPFTVPRGITSATLTLNTLPPDPAVPGAPTLTSIVSRNQALQLSWTAVPGATGYQIFYNTPTSFDDTSLPATFVDIPDGNTTSFQLTGLSNGTPYFVAVRALAQNKFFAAVTAVIDKTLPSNPGSANESSFSQETSQGVGPIQKSAISPPQKDSPEAIAPYPNLKNEGCFIATAAYGFYSAPQVQVLREFRDRYLMTNSPGRAFVAWYYRYGPGGAHFINAHPWLKPPVRLALLPLVLGAMFLTHTPPLVQIAIVMFALIASVFLYQRIQSKMLVYSGGMR